MKMKKIEVPDRPGKWLYRTPLARGARDGPPNGPTWPRRRAFVEILPQASVRNGILSAAKRSAAADVSSAAAGAGTAELGPRRQNCTKSSFLKSSPRGLHVTCRSTNSDQGSPAVRERRKPHGILLRRIYPVDPSSP
ncbi:hypothetical protein THAOC_36851 [Thalassiosira oceanica]|uniref:Uncharacterized protein n=1 Tax=Thalassiosira oceanica TaxID=159749 RepID=K0R167_THAOC|nr:hypothetical protein THAOC_36851 [Thalassiosira oceanica]|eukprot:EJK44599.1 hypothetical protein THAOC_36851 [Thalassiosira oceanica]